MVARRATLSSIAAATAALVFITSAPAVGAPNARSISITQGSSYSMPKGTAVRLKVKLKPVEAKAVRVWKSSNPKVATVTKAGRVKALRVGSARITVKVKGTSISDSIRLTVTKPVLVKSVKVTPSALTLGQGQSAALKATVSPKKATKRAVAWKSANPAVAKVNAGGVVTAVGPGVTTVSARATDTSKKRATVRVTVSLPLVSVWVNTTSDYLERGGQVFASVVLTPSMATVDPTVTWTSSDPGVLAVAADGVVTGVGAGSASVVATVAGVSGSRRLTVARSQTDIAEALAADVAALAVGFRGSDTAQRVTADVTLPSAAPRGSTVRWATSDASTVTDRGRVARSMDGDRAATLTATVENSGQSATRRFDLTVLRLPPDRDWITRVENGAGENSVEILEAINPEGGLAIGANESDGVAMIDGRYTTRLVTDCADAVSSLERVRTMVELRTDDPADEFSCLGPERVEGLDYYRLPQMYEGYPVYGHEVIVVTDGGGDTKLLANGYAPGLDVGIDWWIGEQDVTDAIAAEMGAAVGFTVTETSPTIWVDDDGTGHFAMLARVVGTDSLSASGEYIVDAETGVVLQVIGAVHEAQDTTVTARGLGDNVTHQITTYDSEVSGAGRYQLWDRQRNIKTYRYGNRDDVVGAPYVSADNTWPDGDAVSAHANVAKAMDYYKNLGDRAYMRDREHTEVRVVVRSTRKLDNAFYWDDDVLEFTEIDGAANTLKASYAGALDAVAHEYTHGVARYLGKFQGGSVSKGLNESYADIMGNLIEWRHEGSPDWLLGDDVATDRSNPTRDMTEPYQSSWRSASNEHVVGRVLDFVAHRAWQFNASHQLSREQWSQIWYRSLRIQPPKAGFTDVRFAVLAADK
ncbi:MAG: Ig-like domain-containing protein, partial [Bifidobacteriaceae bacterium]|nr:Ig-like domain-containing protein [Bifidobacteriaceae bacterium]